MYLQNTQKVYKQTLMTDINQKELVKKLKENDPKAFTALYSTYGKKIYSLALHITGSPEDAEDITQETVLTVYKKINSFKQKSSLYTWMYMIAKNLCLRLVQKQKKGSFTTLDGLVNSFQDPEAAQQFTDFEKRYYIKQIKYGCLTGMVRCLSFNQRVAFILHTLLEVPVQQTADVLEKSEGATRSLIHRARKNIKAFMCKNCSLYDNNNQCKCENLIDFSLKQEWIHPPSSYSALHVEQPVEPEQLEQEISSIKKITSLYHSLPESEPSEKMLRKLKKAVKNKEFAIFSPSKVK